MDAFSQATRDLVINVEVVENARNLPLVRQFLKAFLQAEVYQMDLDALHDEVQESLMSVTFKPFDLEGTSGFEEANQARFAIRAARDRVLKINGALRDVYISLTKRYRIGRVFLRKSVPDIEALSAKDAEDVIAVVLHEMHDTLEEVKELLKETREAFEEFNDKAKVVDTWVVLHKEYAFHNRIRRYNDDDDESGSLGRRR